jgi:hypothetical protein
MPGLEPAPAGGQQPLNLSGAHVQPQFDALEYLPPAAADRLRCSATDTACRTTPEVAEPGPDGTPPPATRSHRR